MSSLDLDYLPLILETALIDRTEIFPIVERAFVKYQFSYSSGRKVIREKVVFTFGRNQNLLGCHTFEEEKGRKSFNFIGGDQTKLVRIPLLNILEYSRLIEEN